MSVQIVLLLGLEALLSIERTQNPTFQAVKGWFSYG